MREDIGIAQNIMRLRKEQGLTQEDLAGFLDVTKASVSKWETGQSFPDIALLPRIATCFSVSIDDLMGYAPQMSKKEIRDTYLHLRDKLAEGPYGKAHTLCEKTIHDYWSCPALLVQMAVLYLNHLQQASEGDARDSLIAETQGLCRRVKELSAEASSVRQANAIEAMLFLILGKPEDAVTMLEGTMEPAMGESVLLTQAYLAQGRVEDAERCSQASIYQALIGLLNDLPQLAGMYVGDLTRLTETYVRTAALIQVFDLEKVYVNCAAVYLAFAAAFAQAGDEAYAYECLERYVHLCKKMEFPVKLAADAFFDKVGPWLEDLNLGDAAPRDDDLIKRSMVSGIVDNPSFVGMADETRFKRLVADLEASLV